ncbi:MAG: aminomethyl-transferring glycine dehydrogenase [Paludibacteraceae bacterium]|nr:aminomethyl-transferring glycine dehydrogenase [Paludibacteraceae bacterium]
MKDLLPSRHIGISSQEQQEMLKTLGVETLDQLIEQTVPQAIRLKEPMKLNQPLTERAYLEHLAELAQNNKLYTSYIGQGWYDTITPPVIQRNILENPVWYTSYTPYQAEISQGRLEALFNFQTAISDFTALPLTNCSLLDEATAAAEAVTMMRNLRSRDQVKAGVNRVFVDKNIFPQTLAVLRTRANGQGIEIDLGDYAEFTLTDKHFGVLLQLPNANGLVEDYAEFAAKAHENGCKVAVIADLMSLALLQAPGTWGADICLGSTQRWGIPMGFGGPYAAYFATKDEYKREIPGRIIGMSKDAYDRPAFRLALQTREQHIKREKATSNVCTAEALMAMMAGFYAAYHGAQGIRNIAERIHSIATYINEILPIYGYAQENALFFDTLKIALPQGVTVEKIRTIALEYEVNFHYFNDGTIGISIDETTDMDDVNVLIDIFAKAAGNSPVFVEEEKQLEALISLPEEMIRKVDYLTHEVFTKYHTETEMMRYMKRLERKDISLTHSMIPLGSCTMKLNAAAEMIPITWMQLGAIHPMAPADQTQGYIQMLEGLKSDLCTITGFKGCSLQPTSGAAGEYAGLVVIKAYLNSIGQGHRNVVLIPASAHGTNPASAVQAGFTPVVVKCDEKGNTDLADWEEKANQHADNLAACMITYPSTHGIFESGVMHMCQVVHQKGGQVYMDGANMNAQVGLTNPGVIGADVCHLNLHKTFASPHGGGGPGAGAICVAEQLVPFLPSQEEQRVSSAIYGNAGITCISYGYIRMMGAQGLTDSTKTAILNANYLAAKVGEAYGIVYTGENGRVGHELILDCRNFKEAEVNESDIAKRLMDYGYHAPTLSFPVHGTLMIEPTESESKAELDNFAQALMNIIEEINEIAQGKADKTDNVLKNAPHPEYELIADEWNHSYPRSKAAYPTPAVAANKFWIPVARVDNGWGDRNLIARW